MEIIRCEDLTKIYRSGSSAVRAVDGVSLSFDQGSFTAVIGKSEIDAAAPAVRTGPADRGPGGLPGQQPL